MANENIGSSLYAIWTTSSATVTMQTDFRNFSYTPSISFIDATAGADQNMQRVNSFKDGQLTIDFLMLSTMSSADYASFDEGTNGSVIYGLSGSVAGKLKFTVPAISGGLTQASPYNDVTTLSASFQQNGVRAMGTF